MHNLDRMGKYRVESKKQRRRSRKEDFEAGTDIELPNSWI